MGLRVAVAIVFRQHVTVRTRIPPGIGSVTMGSTARPRRPGAPPSGGSVDENIVRTSPLLAALDEDGKQAVLAPRKRENDHRSATITRGERKSTRPNSSPEA